MLPPVVLWIDPGLMTGLSWLLNGWDFHADEYGFMEAGTKIENTCADFGRSCWVGWERFKIGPHTPPLDAHHAIEMIGVARRYGWRNGCRILTEAQQHTPTALDQQRLKAIGWWVPGKKDAQSAACHMLSWLMRQGEVPPRERAVLDQLTGRVN